MADTIFSKIIDGSIPADVVHRDAHCMAFKDINPQAPVHIVLIPLKPIEALSGADDADQALLGHLLRVAPRIAREQGVDNAYRLICNDGRGAGQEVMHLHFHILGGRELGWPPG
ncbi:MAG: histidine triad nucleotide-binding protein [Gammaproteobacteria bacterium]